MWFWVCRHVPLRKIAHTASAYFLNDIVYYKVDYGTVFAYTCHPRRMRRGGCLRQCTTSRKVAGSIPDSVIGIFHLHNPFGRTMTLGSTQPPREMSTRNIA